MASANVARVQGIYEAFATGDVPAVLGAMSPAMVWSEAENFPYADRNPYEGPEAILEGVFMRLATEWEGFGATPEQFLDAGDHVIALGRYTGVLRATGKAIDAQFAHVWRLAEGKTVSFQQYTDTLQVAEAARG
ncbi:MAG: nuclear transport factor 2 family protein [Sphingomonadaceae bacterium]|nr:nuclear transport factor 2 family protein [Sphingomonadaceae bacterium]